VNALCLECHGPEASPQPVANAKLVTIFNGQVKLPDTYFAKVSILPLKYGVGHPTANHPVSDTLNPKTKSLTTINCLTCHQPHASTHAGLLVKDQEANMAFCKTCHTEGTMQLR
jgi:predicted CXXCH cytochrome family protein